MNVRRSLMIFAGALSLLALVGCGDIPDNADKKEQRATEAITAQAVSQIGMPGVTNFTEKKLVRKLYELRDQEIATFTYMPDMNGKLWHVCDSVGFGLPYGVQFSNPDKLVNPYTTASGYITMPQAEPNGLYMPPSAEGTWVMCGAKNDVKPVYIEPRIVVSSFPLRSAGEYFDK